MSYCPSVQNSTCVWPIHTQSITVLLIFSCSSPPQGCGTLRSSDYSAGAEARAPGRLHRPQQRRLLPEWAEPQSDPGAGGQFPAAGEIHVRHHHTGKRHRESERERERKGILMDEQMESKKNQKTLWKRWQRGLRSEEHVFVDMDVYRFEI